MVDVICPAFVDDTREATIVCWYFQEGQAIQEGDEILEVMTDEMTFKIVADTSGILRNIHYRNGDVVPYFEKLAELDTYSE